MKSEVHPEVVVPESPAASFGFMDVTGKIGRSCGLDEAPGQDALTRSIHDVAAKEIAAMDPPLKCARSTTPSTISEASSIPRRSPTPTNNSTLKSGPIVPRNWKTRTFIAHHSSLRILKPCNLSPAPQHRLDEELYGTTSCWPNSPPSEVVRRQDGELESAAERFRKAIESLERDLQSAGADKTNLEVRHIHALHAKDREIKQVTESLQKLERKHQKEKRASEAKVLKVEADLDNMDERHTKALQEKELQLQQARDETNKLKEYHTKAVGNQELELQQARDEICQLKEQLEARNTLGQEQELATLREEVATLTKRLALAEKPDQEWVKYLPTTTNFYEAAPHLHADILSFDREAKIAEIEKRPSRKQTFGKRLANVRKERGLHPHYLPSKQPPKEPSLTRTADIVMSSEGWTDHQVENRDSDVLSESSQESLSDNEKAMRVFDEMMGVPNNAIPCLVDNQLAWRDGTRVCSYDHPAWYGKANRDNI